MSNQSFFGLILSTLLLFFSKNANSQQAELVVALEHSKEITAIAHNKVTDEIASVSKDLTIKIWSLKSKKLKRTLTITEEIDRLCFVGRNHLLVSKRYSSASKFALLNLSNNTVGNVQIPQSTVFKFVQEGNSTKIIILLENDIRIYEIDALNDLNITSKIVLDLKESNLYLDMLKRGFSDLKAVFSQARTKYFNRDFEYYEKIVNKTKENIRHGYSSVIQLKNFYGEIKSLEYNEEKLLIDGKYSTIERKSGSITTIIELANNKVSRYEFKNTRSKIEYLQLLGMDQKGEFLFRKVVKGSDRLLFLQKINMSNFETDNEIKIGINQMGFTLDNRLIYHYGKGRKVVFRDFNNLSVVHEVLLQNFSLNSNAFLATEDFLILSISENKGRHTPLIPSIHLLDLSKIHSSEQSNIPDHLAFESSFNRYNVAHLDPSGLRLITGAQNGQVDIFDLVNFQKKINISAHDGAVTSLNTYKDSVGLKILTGGIDRQLYVWNELGHKIKTFQYSEQLKGLWQKQKVNGETKLVSTAGMGSISSVLVDGTDPPEIISASKLGFGTSQGYTKWNYESGNEEYMLPLISGELLAKKQNSSNIENELIKRMHFVNNDFYFISSDQLNFETYDVNAKNKIIAYTKAVNTSPGPKYTTSGALIHNAQASYEVNATKIEVINYDQSKRGLYQTDQFEVHLKFAKSGDQLFAGGNNGEVELIDLVSSNQKEIYKHDGEIMTLDVSQDYLISSGSDGLIKLFDIDKKKLILSIASSGPDWVAFTPDRYFYATRNGAKKISYTYENQVYTFDQFDLQYNRPDIILERLGKASPELIHAFRAAYIKRLQKMGFDKDKIQKFLNGEFDTSFNIPKVEILSPSRRYIRTEDAKVDIEFGVLESEYDEIERLILKVNNVPIYGSAGINLQKVEKANGNYKVQINLTSGQNIVSLAVVNSEGIYSYEEKIEVTRLNGNKKSNLHIISIGISDYANIPDLTYADKDATDFVTALKTQKAQFESIKHYSFLNEKASKDKILSVRNSLLETSIEDMVVFFLAGHGVISKDLEWHFATHPFDLLNPSVDGLSIDDIEGLMEGIPARNRLIFIDACHSGEIDQDDLRGVQENDVEYGDVTFRQIGGYKPPAKDNTLGVINSFQLMSELFNDLRTGSGSNIISSAGGAEYALESTEWNNGVFTYSVLEGMKSGNADKNDDGRIQIEELKKYVGEKVIMLTNGRQRPTSRQQNPDNNFVLWTKD